MSIAIEVCAWCCRGPGAPPLRAMGYKVAVSNLRVHGTEMALTALSSGND